MDTSKSLGKMYVIKVNGSITDETLDAEPTLERLHELLGGYIERVSGFEVYGGQHCIALCNEEGKLEHMGPMPVNRCATALWWGQLVPSSRIDTLNGPIVILTGKRLIRKMMEGDR